MAGGSRLGRAGANLRRALRRGVASAALPRGRFWVRLRLSDGVPEIAAPWSRRGHEAMALVDVLRTIDAASRDSQVAGLLLRMGGPPGGMSRCESLRRALRAARAADLPVVVWSESYGTEDLWLASAATRLLLPPSGAISLVGLRAERTYWKGLLDRIGVRPDVVRAGAYKTAAEPFLRDRMSPEQREQTDAWLADAFDSIVGGIAEGRGLSESDVRTRIDEGPYSADAAREAGLVDRLRYPDEVEADLLELAEDAVRNGRPAVVDARAYAAFRVRDAAVEPISGPSHRIAYVVARGGIGRGRSLRGVGADTYRQLLEELRETDAISGVLLRVDSPGGEVVASDLLARAVGRVAERKPIVVSMGDVAASGGYLLAAPADAIVAEATSLTGSIGVVGGKIDASELYERLGIHREAVQHGARAGLHSEARGFTPDERQAVEKGIASIYDQFVDRVADGRSLDRRAVERVAQGRVWSGRQAKEHGLVDRLGGPLEALADLRERVGLSAGEVAPLVVLPRLPRFALPALLGTRSRADGGWV